ncbi:MAG: type II toxin-antitoxin system Phd/YefM family antitoxin [Clostridiales bacterium]|jgi:prevent-host-death family protein|nr:type II toxin-antitoxin system Phd/YefM family antitoxin [Clostridiales bacterium]
MIVTSTEFKTNLGKYLDLINREEVIITRNGRKIAKLVREEDDALSSLRSLRGIIADPELSQATDTQIREIIAQERSARQ